MAAIEIKALSVCSGGDHVRLQVSVNGNPKATADVEVSQILNNFSPEEAELVALVLARMVAIGKTKAQTKAALQAGVMVNV